MGFAFPSFPIILSFLVFVFMVLKIWKRSKPNDTSSNLPPEPWRLPVKYWKLAPACCFLPHHRLRDLAMKYGPFMHLQVGDHSMIIVSSPEFATEVIKIHHAS
ncbi:hypothetical protein ACOSQ2_030492 [Xanthoceras sorbifolium]